MGAGGLVGFRGFKPFTEGQQARTRGTCVRASVAIIQLTQFRGFQGASVGRLVGFKGGSCVRLSVPSGEFAVVHFFGSLLVKGAGCTSLIVGLLFRTTFFLASQ